MLFAVNYKIFSIKDILRDIIKYIERKKDNTFFLFLRYEYPKQFKFFQAFLF